MPLIPSFASKYFGGKPSTLRGMALMLFSAICGSTMVAGVRYLSAELHPFEIAFGRMAFGFLMFVPLFIQRGFEPLETKRLGLQGLRGGLHLCAMLLYFYGLTLTPLAKVTAISFSAPLYATILAIMVLGEVVRARRITALIIGFAGTMVILRPGAEIIDVGALFILAAAVMWGLALIVIKILGRTEPAITTTIYSTVVVTPFAFLACLPYWQWPTLEQLVWFAAIGTIGNLAHLSLNQAFKEADITAVLPFDFTKLIWAALYGFFIFGEIPDWGVWVGGIMIFASVTYIALRERRLRGRQASVPPVPTDGAI